MVVLEFRRQASNRPEHNCWVPPLELDSLVVVVAVAESEHNLAAEVVDSCSVAQAPAMSVDNCQTEQELDSLYLAAANNLLRLVAMAIPDNCLDMDCWRWPCIAVLVAVDFVDSRTREMNRCAPSYLALRECVFSVHSMSYQI